VRLIQQAESNETQPTLCKNVKDVMGWRARKKERKKHAQKRFL
jgi:hypothetical protein